MAGESILRGRQSNAGRSQYRWLTGHTLLHLFKQALDPSRNHRPKSSDYLNLLQSWKAAI